MSTAVRSHAKINLGLYIGAPRPDGFHALATVYQTLALYDVVTVAARPAAATALRLTSNDRRVPTDNRNTAWKMVALALESLGISAEVEIHIEKRLPVQGGMGAGSANAVAALVGLEAELGLAQLPGAPGLASETWESQTPDSQKIQSFSQIQASSQAPGIPQMLGAPSSERSLLEGWDSTNPNFTASTPWSARRLEIAAQVGSDVPLFLIGGTILGLDRGQEVYPLPDIAPVWCVIATPEVGVSTPQAFHDWDALCQAEGLTPEASADKLKMLSRAYASAFAGAIPEGQQGTGSSGVLPVQCPGRDLAGPQESALVRTGISSWIRNDFERVVFPQHPPLAEIKRILAASDTPEAALHASLSGSGSALFGLYLTRGDAEAAQARLKEQFRQVELRTTLTRTLPRSIYWREMLLG